MNKKTVLARMLFLLLLVAAAAAMGPLVSYINNEIKSAAKYTMFLIETATGLKVSYSYMSPAILWNINIRGITLTESRIGDKENEEGRESREGKDSGEAGESRKDKDGGENRAEGGGPNALVSVRRLTLRYSIISIIKGDIDNAFSALTIDGVDINIDAVRDRSVIDRLNALKEKLPKVEVSEEGAAEKSLEGDTSELSNNLRFVSHSLNLAIVLRHVNVHYADKWGSAAVSLNSINLRRNRREHYLRLAADGAGEVNVPKSGVDATSLFKADITLRPDLDDSSAVLRLKDVKQGSIAVKSLNVLTGYSGGAISIETIQSPLPLAAKCTIDLKQKTIESNVKTVSLPVRRVFSPKVKGIKDAALDTAVTMNTDFMLDLNGSPAIGYNSNGSIALPNSLTHSGMITMQYALMGDGKRLRLSRFKANGAKCDVAGDLLYTFRTMQATGTLNARRITLPNGIDISGQFMLDPISDRGQKGFALFAPQLTVADASLTALEVKVMPNRKSIDFSAEVYDYSHAGDSENGEIEPGAIRISGSYLTAEKSVLSSVTVQQYYADSLIALVSTPSIKEREAQYSTSERLKDFMFAGELYAALDKGGLSYNVPYALVANTKKENQALYISLDGNRDSMNVSQLDIAYGNHGANITAHVESARELGGAFFTLEAVSAAASGEMAVPYHFSGSITGENGERQITVSDEYGSMLQVSMHGGMAEGSLAMNAFPVRVGKGFFTFTTETGFAWTREDGVAIHVARFETIGENTGDLSLSPHLVMSGEVSKYGAFFDKMSYTDTFSALDGSATAFLNMDKGIFDSAKLDFNLSSVLSGESVALSLEVTNPDYRPFTLRDVMEHFYFNATLSLNSFATSRFVSERSENNTLTAQLDATGTIADPYISLDVSRASMMFASIPIIASGKAIVIDKVLTVADTKVRYGEVNLTEVEADLNMEAFTGSARAMLDIGLDKSLFSMPMTLELMDSDVSPSTHLPVSFTVAMGTEGARGAFIKDRFPFSVTLMRSEHETAIFSSDNLGISGYFVDGGEMNVTSDSALLGFHISGKNDWERLDFAIEDINIDIASIVSRFNNANFAMYKGILTGNLNVGGIRSDPDFVGDLAIEGADFSLLKVVPYHITGKRVAMQAVHSQIDIPEVALLDVDKTVFVNGRIMFDRWMFDNMELFVRTPQGKTAPALLDVGLAAFDGDASIDITVNIDRNKILEVTGAVYVENTKANVRAREVMNLSDIAHSDVFSRRIDVDIAMGPHTNVTLDPILRAVLLPKSTVNFKMDEDTDSFSLKGDVGIKSGDIAWLGRSFYLKDGVIRFNDNEDSFDPIITLKAETRDRDDDGRDVKITMNVANQPLSRFSPKFSSVPVKSENEIRAMLGQIAVGVPGESETSASDVMLSLGDFAVTATVGRAVENSIRDLFKFDIFSIRTAALQNVLKSTFATEQGNNNITAGNLLDNSTVYIGKYIGSVIYLDAMLHLSYDEHKNDDIGTKNGILFQPEIGFELDAPFAGIRWSMAPNIDAMKQNMFMPTTSVTLSWGFSF